MGCDASIALETAGTLEGGAQGAAASGARRPGEEQDPASEDEEGDGPEAQEEEEMCCTLEGHVGSFHPHRALGCTEYLLDMDNAFDRWLHRLLQEFR